MSRFTPTERATEWVKDHRAGPAAYQEYMRKRLGEHWAEISVSAAGTAIERLTLDDALALWELAKREYSQGDGK